MKTRDLFHISIHNIQSCSNNVDCREQDSSVEELVMEEGGGHGLDPRKFIQVGQANRDFRKNGFKVGILYGGIWKKSSLTQRACVGLDLN